MAGTIAASDLYGATPPGRKYGDVASQPVAVASGPVSANGSKSAASIWIGLVAALIVLRFAWEAAK